MCPVFKGQVSIKMSDPKRKVDDNIFIVPTNNQIIPTNNQTVSPLPNLFAEKPGPISAWLKSIQIKGETKVIAAQNAQLIERTALANNYRTAVLAEDRAMKVHREIADSEEARLRSIRQITREEILAEAEHEVSIIETETRREKAMNELKSEKKKSSETEDQKIQRELEKTKKMVAVNEELDQIATKRKFDQALNATIQYADIKNGLIAKYGEEKAEELAAVLERFLAKDEE